MFTYDLTCGSSPYINWLYGTIATMFTYDLPCGSSPYINCLYGTMVQCLHTIYHAGVPLAWIDYTEQWHNLYVRLIMREFPLQKVAIPNNATMFTYDLLCVSSPYINWLFGTMAQCLRTIYHAGVPLHKVTIRNNCHNVYLRFTMREFPLNKLNIRYNCHDVYVRFTMRQFPLHKLTIWYNAAMFTYDLPCGSSPCINWLYGTMAQCLRTIYHAGVPLT